MLGRARCDLCDFKMFEVEMCDLTTPRSASATSAAGAKAIQLNINCLRAAEECLRTAENVPPQVCEVAFGTVDAGGLRQCSKEVSVVC